MALPDLVFNFHDAGIDDIKVGPRNEITLVVGLDDPDYPPHQSAFIRFGGVSNLHEVAQFLAAVPPARSQSAYRARVDRLAYDPEQLSQRNRLVIRLELDMFGSIVIRCAKVSVGMHEQPH